MLAILLIEPPGGMLYELAHIHLQVETHSWVVSRETALATFGPLWFIGTHVFHTTFYVGVPEGGSFTRIWIASGWRV